MLAGDDFKKDTQARGILVVDIHSGHDFRCGDAAIPLIRKAGADPYCSVGWAKFGEKHIPFMQKPLHPNADRRLGNRETLVVNKSAEERDESNLA
jgi:hypothetical protein